MFARTVAGSDVMTTFRGREGGERCGGLRGGLTARACSSLHASLQLRFVSKVFRSTSCAAAAADLVLHSLLNSNGNNCTTSVCERQREGGKERRREG